MISNSIKKRFNKTSDLHIKTINNITIIYLESLCSSDKINNYIIKNIILKEKYLYLKDILSSPNIIYLENEKQADYYLLNGYAIVSNKKDIIACEVQGNLTREISIPTTETSINGPKDSFVENIVPNLGLIKRRIKSQDLINKDYTIGRISKTKVSLLYLKNITKKEIVNLIDKKISSIDIDAILDIEQIENIINKENINNPLPTFIKTERPDRAINALLEGKIIILVDNSPYALIIPGFLLDFINPEGDNYVKAINVNFLKILRFICFIITILLPALYIAIINFSPESIPLKLLLSFKEGRNGVPFPSAFESIFMITLCAILRESDIRFPSNYGSSISILGALILGEAAVKANIASPIMIIIIGITFITGLIFSNGDIIDGLRLYRFFLLILSILFGLYGITIGIFIILIHLSNIKVLNKPYLYGLSPDNKNYLNKTLFKNNKINNRNKLLTNNTIRSK